MTKFYDTSSLLIKGTSIFDTGEKFAISSITLEELEAFSDKNIVHDLLLALNKYKYMYDIHIFTESMIKPIIEKKLLINNNTKILACAFDYNNTIDVDDTYFITNDLELKNIANLFFGDGMIESVVF